MSLLSLQGRMSIILLWSLYRAQKSYTSIRAHTPVSAHPKMSYQLPEKQKKYLFFISKHSQGGEYDDADTCSPALLHCKKCSLHSVTGWCSSKKQPGEGNGLYIVWLCSVMPTRGKKL